MSPGPLWSKAGEEETGREGWGLQLPALRAELGA